jgi:hypothetical protein
MNIPEHHNDNGHPSLPLPRHYHNKKDEQLPVDTALGFAATPVA